MKTKKSIGRLFYSKSTVLAFLLLVVVTSIVFSDKNFLSATNVFNILLKAAKNGGFLALGMTFVILCAEIDLSVGAVFALSGVVMGIVGTVNPFLGIACGILVGVVSGLAIVYGDKNEDILVDCLTGNDVCTARHDTDYSQKVGSDRRRHYDVCKCKDAQRICAGHEKRHFDSCAAAVFSDISMHVCLQAYEVWHGHLCGRRKL